MPAAAGQDAIMPGRLKKHKRPRAAHTKYVGVQPATLKRYRRALRLFFGFLDLFGFVLPDTFQDLDDVAGEYLNHLYLDDYPPYVASDFLSGDEAAMPAHTPASSNSQTVPRQLGSGYPQSPSYPNHGRTVDRHGYTCSVAD